MLTYTIRGTIRGELYWPIGAPAEKPVEATFTTDGRPFASDFDRSDGIRGMVEILLDHEGGDFSNAPVLMADSVLIIARDHRERAFELVNLPSVADYVAPDYPEFAED